MLVVVRNPRFKGTGEGERTGPRLPPEAFRWPCAHHPLGGGVPRGVVSAGTGRRAPQGPAGPPEGRRGRLTAMVTPQRPLLALKPPGNWRLTAMSRAESPWRAVLWRPA
jgi:hypothetical protein